MSIDAELVEGELILPQHAELSRRGRPCRCCGGELAGQQLHEGGLAGAVRAGEAVAAARRRMSSVTSSKSTFDPNRIETP